MPEQSRDAGRNDRREWRHRGSRRSRGGLKVGAATAGACAALALAGSALATTTPWGSGSVDARHTAVACDVAADGVGVRTEFYRQDGVLDSATDSNGAGNGCASKYSASTITYYRLCRYNPGAPPFSCTSWQNP